ncbi:hypothetical protein AMD26_012605 [Deinococcus sp. UR1]|nr:hypothetical protein AMD26_012605 [Deinococcus sp. UR1]
MLQGQRIDRHRPVLGVVPHGADTVQLIDQTLHDLRGRLIQAPGDAAQRVLTVQEGHQAFEQREQVTALDAVRGAVDRHGQAVRAERGQVHVVTEFRVHVALSFGVGMSVSGRGFSGQRVTAAG